MKCVCLHCTISVSHVHWTIQSHNLSLEVVILFHRFLILTVDKLVLWFYHETRTDCSRDSIYLLVCWYAVCSLSCHIKTSIFIIVWFDWSQAICIRTKRDIYMHYASWDTGRVHIWKSKEKIMKMVFDFSFDKSKFIRSKSE